MEVGGYYPASHEASPSQIDDEESYSGARRIGLSDLKNVTVVIPFSTTLINSNLAKGACTPSSPIA